VKVVHASRLTRPRRRGTVRWDDELGRREHSWRRSPRSAPGNRCSAPR
jgi:hypothetical protein